MRKKSDYALELDLAQAEVIRLRESMRLPAAIFPVPVSAIERRFMRDPDECPYCKSKSTECIDTDGGSHTTTLRVECTNCGAAWTEHYELTGVTDFTSAEDM